jgi:hypothetical protein
MAGAAHKHLGRPRLRGARSRPAILMLRALSSARLLRGGRFSLGGTNVVCRLDRLCAPRSCASTDLIDDERCARSREETPVPEACGQNGLPSFACVASETLASIANRYAANVTIISRFA